MQTMVDETKIGKTALSVISSRAPPPPAQNRSNVYVTPAKRAQLQMPSLAPKALENCRPAARCSGTAWAECGGSSSDTCGAAALNSCRLQLMWRPDVTLWPRSHSWGDPANQTHLTRLYMQRHGIPYTCGPSLVTGTRSLPLANLCVAGTTASLSSLCTGPRPCRIRTGTAVLAGASAGAHCRRVRWTCIFATTSMEIESWTSKHFPHTRTCSA
jgi:hypothetical protein